MSQLEVDKVIPQSGTTLTLGESGDTVSVPSGATLDASSATLTLPDGSVTAAKLASTAVDNTNTNSTVITGQTAETSIDGADLVLIYDDSATALRKMTRTNFFTAQPTFGAYQSSVQTIPSGTFTKINFQTEEFDTNSNYSTTDMRFTPTVAGYYYFTANIAIASSATNAIISFYKNGSEFKRANYIVNSAVNVNSGSALISLNGSTDYVEAFVYLATGQNLTTVQTETYFQGFFVRTL
jgi:hypothetical protein